MLVVLKAMLRKFSIFEYVGDFSNLRTKVYERGPLLIVGLITYVTILWVCHFCLEFVYELNGEIVVAGYCLYVCPFYILVGFCQGE